MYAPVCSGKGLVRLRIDRFKPFVAHRARVSCRNHGRQVGEGFARSRTTDGTMRNKYDQAQAQDMPIVERVLEVAEHHEVPMAQVALAWHWAKGVTAPIVGCSKPERVDDAIAALGVQLTEEDIAHIEEPYTAHELVGPLSRPEEKDLSGALAPTLKETTRN